MPDNFLRPVATVVVVLGLLACASDGPTGPRTTPLRGSLAVGDLVTVNVNGLDDCTNPTLHVARVEAVGTRALILNDTLNPKNGFTTADFERFAAKFDTLIYPVDVGAFGEPTDIDENGHIGLIFTRAVNELTPANSDSYVGGFTFSRDLFPVKDTDRAFACATSNQGEFFYLLAPDPNGEVNNNRRSTAFVDLATTPVIAHEFQHLINASRRLYVNVNSSAFEATWLDEGLAHVAEELLYYHEAGYLPRTNRDAAAVRATAASVNAFNSDMTGNFGRYKIFLQNPSNNSPYNAGDSLPTRGAAWSLLRYLADEKIAGFPATASPALRSTGTSTISAPGIATNSTDYAAVVVNTATNQLAAVNYSIQVTGATADRMPVSDEPMTASRSVLFGGVAAGALTPDRAFESRLRERERRLMPRQAARARAWYHDTRAGAMMPRASRDVVPGTSLDGDTWYRLANAVDTGIVNLQNAFGIDAGVAVRNWSVSNQVDDLSGIVPAEYLQPSWNWHSLYTNLVTSSTTYPLVARTLQSSVPLSGSVIGGGSGYYRFSVPVAGNATVTLIDISGVPASTLQLVLVRTR